MTPSWYQVGFKSGFERAGKPVRKKDSKKRAGRSGSPRAWALLTDISVPKWCRNAGHGPRGVQSCHFGQFWTSFWSPGGSKVVILDNFGPHFGAFVVILDDLGCHSICQFCQSAVAGLLVCRSACLLLPVCQSAVLLFFKFLAIGMLIAGQGTVAGRPKASGYISKMQFKKTFQIACRK